jgi:PTH1 family peptidyl-tRNA hydrolase
MRIRPGGSAGGHHGLESIEAHLGTERYARLRIGIGGSSRKELADYVLGKFFEEERPLMEGAVLLAIEALDLWMSVGINEAMQVANRVKKSE